MKNTSIGWCDDTVNVVEGCTEVDTDCARCYARDIAARFSQPHKDGAQGHYHGLARYSEKRHLPQWTGVVRLFPERLDEMFWRLLRAPTPRRQFLCSEGDIFHREVPDAFLDDVFARIAILESRRARGLAYPRGLDGTDLTPPLAQMHPIYMLTKRPERAAEYTNDAGVSARIEEAAGTFIKRASDRPKRFRALAGFKMPAWPLRSVALITSAGTQAGAEARISQLLRCNAAIRGVSCEPMTGPVDFSRLRYEEDGAQIELDALSGGRWRWPKSGERSTHESGHAEPMDLLPALDWVILGGESGAGARPCELSWLESAAAQVQAAVVPLFVKQLGKVLAKKLGRPGKGHELADLPPHLRVRQYPEIRPAS